MEEYKLRVYDKPKRALGSYIFFVKNKYTEIREKHKNADPGDILGKIAEEWKKLNEKARQKIWWYGWKR